MTQKEYDLFNAINSEGLDNSQWGLWKFQTDTDTETQFGTEAPFPLEKDVCYLTLWLSREPEIYSFIDKVIEHYKNDIYEVLDDTDFYVFKL